MEIESSFCKQVNVKGWMNNCIAGSGHTKTGNFNIVLFKTLKKIQDAYLTSGQLLFYRKRLDRNIGFEANVFDIFDISM